MREVHHMLLKEKAGSREHMVPAPLKSPEEVEKVLDACKTPGPWLGRY